MRFVIKVCYKYCFLIDICVCIEGKGFMSVKSAVKGFWRKESLCFINVCILGSYWKRNISVLCVIEGLY